MNINPNQFNMFGPADEPAPRLEQEEGPKHFVSPRQYPMFMSAREITDRFSPLEGDRKVAGTDHYPADFAANVLDEILDNSSFIEGLRNEGYGTSEGLEHIPGRKIYRAGLSRPIRLQSYDDIEYGSPAWERISAEASRRAEGYELETDDELYDRKFDEAQEDGLDTAIYEEGVQKPISLESNRWGNKGNQGQILGGHHRVAVQKYNNPDALNPVLFHRGLYEAKTDRNYPYS